MSGLIGRRKLIAGAVGASLLGGCIWPRFFDIGWDEEVQLHDGRIIVVKVKYTYERLGNLVFDRYERTILRNTEFSFDAGPPLGRFMQLFQKHRVNMLDYLNGRWYLLLQTVGGPNFVKNGEVWNEEWGPRQNDSGYKCLRLGAEGLSEASMNELPDAFLRVNILMDFAPLREIASLAGTNVNLLQKTDITRKYPLNPGDIHIERPQRATSGSR